MTVDREIIFDFNMMLMLHSQYLKYSKILIGVKFSYSIWYTVETGIAEKLGGTSRCINLE